MDELSIINSFEVENYEALDEIEIKMLKKGAELLQLGYPDHSLLEIWNAGIRNLRRRVEIYSIDMFISTISQLGGRNKYNREGDTIPERWSGVDDDNLLKGAVQLGILNKKAGKALEMIQWMRNRASPSHDTDESVSVEDVHGLILIIKNNLFEYPLPNPGHSPAGFIEPIKNEILTEEQIELYKEQIRNHTNKNIRTLFGFSMEIISEGEEPSYSNIDSLFSEIWTKATEDLKSGMGLQFQNYLLNDSNDNAKSRIYEMLVKVSGIKYIPETTRAIIYRKMAHNLANAKNTGYGWALETSASRELLQIGVHVPSIVFEELYQEILSVWCGNFWGRSSAYLSLESFVFDVPTQEKLRIIKLFETNERVKSELFQEKPNATAVYLIESIKEQFTVESHISEANRIIELVKQYQW